MERLMELLFWGSLILGFYTFFIYPGMLLILTRLSGRLKPSGPGPTPALFQPRVTFIIAAHNEEAIIEKKLLNTLTMDYTGAKLQIIVASDGSTDTTNQIVRRYQQQGVSLLDLQQRKGKTHAQNRAAGVAGGEILVFSDANALWAKDALALLVQPFCNPKVGYVCGQLKYVHTKDNGGYSEGLYWKYELLLRRLESSLLSVTAGNGAIYAVRAADYVQIAPLYCHDLELPHTMVAQGKRALYEPLALATERVAENPREEYGRKIRMLARTWHRIITGPSLYNPFKYGLVYTWMMVSHRLCRYLMPLIQIVFLLATALLWKQGVFYQGALMLQAVFYLLALGGWLFGFQSKIFTLPYYFNLVNFSSLLGFLYALGGKVAPTWEKAPSTRK